jgi:hypothetical protein
MGATRSNTGIEEMIIGSKEEFVAGDILQVYLPQTGMGRLPVVMSMGSDDYNADTVDCKDTTMTDCTDGPTLTGPGCTEGPTLTGPGCGEGPTLTGPGCGESSVSSCSTIQSLTSGDTCS